MKKMVSSPAPSPMRDEFGYFGYLKKMILTLHNVKIMKMGRLPFHGAMFNITVRDKGSYTVMIIGDSGAGKSESLEALRTIAGDDIEDITIIADDMGSIDIDPDTGKFSVTVLKQVPSCAWMISSLAMLSARSTVPLS